MTQSNDGSPSDSHHASGSMSESFKKIASANGYQTVEEILAIPLTELVQKDWFTPAMLEELALIIKRST